MTSSPTNTTIPETWITDPATESWFFFIYVFCYRTLKSTLTSASAPRSAMLKPKDTLMPSGAMNLSRSTEELKPHPTNPNSGKVAT